MSENAFSLIVCLPGEEPVRHDLAGDVVTFGRSPENQIQMLVAEVSVKHGRFEREGGGYRVVDPGSTNGTRVNGVPLGPEGAPLKPMDQLVVGTVVNVYYVPAAVLAATPIADLVASLEASKSAATPKTAPVALVAPAAGAPPAAARPPAPGAPARAAVPVASPPSAPATPGGTTVRLTQVRGPGVNPPGAAPLRPPAPSQAGRPPAAPGAGTAPGGLQPVPLKRPEPSGPTIPLPKVPPKLGQ